MIMTRRRQVLEIQLASYTIAIVHICCAMFLSLIIPIPTLAFYYDKLTFCLAVENMMLNTMISNQKGELNWSISVAYAYTAGGHFTRLGSDNCCSHNAQFYV